MEWWGGKDYCTCESQGELICNTIKVTHDSRGSRSEKEGTETGGKIFKFWGMTRWSEDNSIDKSFFNLRQIKAYTVINFHKWLKLLKPLALDSADWTQFWACPIISYVTLWLWMYCLTFLSLFHHLEHKDNTSAYIIGLLWRLSNIMECLTKPGREEALNIASCYLFR